MSKIATLGSIRFNMGYPNKYSDWMNHHYIYFHKFLIPKLTSELNQEDSIVIMGDLFDYNLQVPMEIIIESRHIFKKLGEIANVYIILGSKDIRKINGKIYTSADLIGDIPNVNFINEITKIDNNYLVPFGTNKSQLDASGILEINIDNIFINTKSNILQHPVFKKCNNIFTCHDYIHANMNNVFNVGSVFQMNIKEIDTKKGLYLIDDNPLFVNNNISVKYIEINLSNESDIVELEQYKSMNFINLTINSDLINSNRSYKRRIDMILNQREFNKITYTPVTVLEDTQEQLIKKVDSGIPFEDMVVEHINSGKYDESVASVMLKEFEYITQILNRKKKLE